jgi:hypothetical protein
VIPRAETAMATTWNWAWLTVAFVSELAALAALAQWGWSVSTATGPRLLLAVGTPLVAAVLWGLFAAPNAPVQSATLSVLVKLAVFGSGVLALLATGHPRLAVLLAAAALFSSVLSAPPVAPVAG